MKKQRIEEDRLWPKLTLRKFNSGIKSISFSFKPSKALRLISFLTVIEMDSTVMLFSQTLLKKVLLRRTPQLT